MDEKSMDPIEDELVLLSDRKKGVGLRLALLLRFSMTFRMG